MSNTPERINASNISISSNLTPVRFLDSPRSKTPNKDCNVSEIMSRLEIIIKTLQDNYAKWKLAEKRGITICNAIEAIKTRVLSVQGKSQIPPSDFTLYPEDMKPYCDKLAVLARIFSDIVKSTQQSMRQLRSLMKLPGCRNEIFYRSWKIEQFVYFVESLLVKYLKECEVKQLVMEELPHSSDRALLIRHSTAWEYPQYVDEDVTLSFKFLAEEMNMKKR